MRVLITEALYKILTEEQLTYFDRFLDAYRHFFNNWNIAATDKKSANYQFAANFISDPSMFATYVVTSPNKALSDKALKQYNDKFDADSEREKKAYVMQNFDNIIEDSFPFFYMLHDDLDFSYNKISRLMGKLSVFVSSGYLSKIYKELLKKSLFVNQKQENNFLKLAFEYPENLLSTKEQQIDFLNLLGSKIFRLPFNVGEFLADLSKKSWDTEIDPKAAIYDIEEKYGIKHGLLSTLYMIFLIK
jgi:hypothetical protein